jgi:hypothetical protein
MTVSNAGAAALLMSFILLAVGAGLHISALDEARERFSPQFQESFSARFAFEAFIWNSWVPARARRKHVISLVCASAAFACIAAVMLLDGPRYSALAFGAIFLLAAARTLRNLIKYRKMMGRPPGDGP